MHKLNVLHWHLTDDQAWRLEIRSIRSSPPSAPGASRRATPRRPTSIPRPASRGSTAASTRRRPCARSWRTPRSAASSSCPRSRCRATPRRRLPPIPQLAAIANPPKAVPADWGIYPHVYNLEEPTFRFLEDVLDEVMELFPGLGYIHIGGDEVEKAQWRDSPSGQQRMRALESKEPELLQAYFTQRIAKILEAHKKRLVGWDEILERRPAAQLGGDVVARDRRRARRRGPGLRHRAGCASDAVLRQPPVGRAATSPPAAAMSSRCRTCTASSRCRQRSPRKSAGTCSACRASSGASTSAPRSAWRTWRFRAPRRSRSSAGRSPRAASGAISCAGCPRRYRGTRRCGCPLPTARSPRARRRASAGDAARVELANQSNFGEIRYTTDGSEPTAKSARYEAPLTAPAQRRAARRDLRRRTPPVAHAPGVPPERAGFDAREPGPEAVHRAHRALARGRCAVARAAEGIPRGHPEPVLDLQGRRARWREEPGRLRRPGAVQFPDRRGGEEDHASRSRSPPRASSRCGSAARASCWRALPLAPATRSQAVTTLPGVRAAAAHRPRRPVPALRAAGSRAALGDRHRPPRPMTLLVLHAPLPGWCAGLEEVPDPVFAERMAGRRRGHRSDRWRAARAVRRRDRRHEGHEARRHDPHRERPGHPPARGHRHGAARRRGLRDARGCGAAREVGRAAAALRPRPRGHAREERDDAGAAHRGRGREARDPWPGGSRGRLPHGDRGERGGTRCQGGARRRNPAPLQRAVRARAARASRGPARLGAAPVRCASDGRGPWARRQCAQHYRADGAGRSLRRHHRDPRHRRARERSHRRAGTPAHRRRLRAAERGAHACRHRPAASRGRDRLSRRRGRPGGAVDPTRDRRRGSRIGRGNGIATPSRGAFYRSRASRSPRGRGQRGAARDPAGPCGADRRSRTWATMRADPCGAARARVTRGARLRARPSRR